MLNLVQQQMGFRWFLPETCVNADLYNYPKLSSKQMVSPSVILHLNKNVSLKHISNAVCSIHLSSIFCQALLPKRNSLMKSTAGQVEKVVVATLDKTLGNVHHFCNDTVSKLKRN